MNSLIFSRKDRLERGKAPRQEKLRPQCHIQDEGTNDDAFESDDDDLPFYDDDNDDKDNNDDDNGDDDNYPPCPLAGCPLQAVCCC